MWGSGVHDRGYRVCNLRIERLGSASATFLSWDDFGSAHVSSPLNPTPETLKP